MSLDKNLFTLFFTPHKDNQNVIDLVDPSGIIHYRKQRSPGEHYKIEVYDPMSESLLASASAPSAASKVKTIELCNPTSVVELKHTGTLSFRWSFKWEDHEFEWKREECFMIRKPDPPVIIAVTKEPTGRLRTTSVQILDYNLNRFDIDDRKGLEITVLTALLTFQDANEAYHTPEASTASSSNPLSRTTSSPTNVSPSPAGNAPPPPPPKPAPKTGVDRIAELQAIKGEYNEIIVSEEGTVQDYAAYCTKMLEDDAILFISVKSAEAEQVPKVLQVVEETKRIRYKAGLSEEEQLHQYVLYDQQEQKKGPRIINLDDQPKNKYEPPKNLTVHLSKISMPELQPKAHGNDKSTKESKRKEEKKAATSKPPRPAPAPPAPSAPSPQNAHSSSSNSRPPNKLQRPGRDTSPKHRVHAHQMHPNQPSPSPSQINNPSIYVAPPPSKPGNRPSSSSNARPTSMVAPSFPQPQTPTYGNSSYGGPGPSLYGSHARHSSTSQAPYAQPNPPTPPPPPTVHAPQPVNASQSSFSALGMKPITTANVIQGASTVVHGLMDALNKNRNKLATK
ncbi:hypothetical protein NLJ89_g11041 [Agrocybe chaxingu]|uniref:Uncharacterized protein n=1 Tax=Agrocybe chaxingu TaxID=84603 RepID=A0A9W8JQ08_9AGAR|nr:hypothetical protein NLJ89_g11041 [Agrocybe chaxingu]